MVAFDAGCIGHLVSALRPGGAVAALVELVFDSALQAAPAGFRAGPTGERRLLYRVRRAAPDGDALEVDLHVKRSPRGDLELVGQCAPVTAGTRVAVRAGRTEREVDAGGAGEFVVRGLPARSRQVDVIVRAPDAEAIVIVGVPAPEDGPERP